LAAPQESSGKNATQAQRSLTVDWLLQQNNALPRSVKQKMQKGFVAQPADARPPKNLAVQTQLTATQHFCNDIYIMLRHTQLGCSLVSHPYAIMVSGTSAQTDTVLDHVLFT